VDSHLTDKKAGLLQHSIVIRVEYIITVEYLTAVYPAHAKEECIKRRDRACTQLHINICKLVGVKMEGHKW
jgi:hypothetical protein